MLKAYSPVGYAQLTDFGLFLQSENDDEYEDGEEEDPEKVDLPEGVPLSQVLSNDFQGQ